MPFTARYILLYPFSKLFELIVTIRNRLYDIRLLSSVEKKVPVLVVGNLTVGGTGKTPFTEFLIEMLQHQFNLAVLSRGYKRKTSGFVLAAPGTGVAELGDEPRQMALKYPEIPVAVCENRSIGIDRLMELYPTTELILLDDAFQHRRILPRISFLLTDYNRLHTRDSLLPGGNLREPLRGSRRATALVVTKCPDNLSPQAQEQIIQELKPLPHQPVYFTGLRYGTIRSISAQHSEIQVAELHDTVILLVTGIVSPRSLEHYLCQYCKKIETIQFPDHHNFSTGDLKSIESALASISHKNKLIITTEKDAVRLNDSGMLSDSLKKHIFVVPVKVQLLTTGHEVFIQKITDYVRENSGNC
jgi:tetraacyldisaccharide 4'-kinase